jgi:hypothetical protein
LFGAAGWMKISYLIAIGSGTIGWLWLIGWIAIQII